MKRLPKTNLYVVFLLKITLLLIIVTMSLECGIRFMQYKGYLNYQEIPVPEDISIDSHPFLPYVWKPNLYKRYASGGHLYCMRTNSHGIIGDREFAIGRHSGVFRIMCLGGSTTYNPGSEYDTDWPHLLGKIIQERHPEVRVEVLNLACMGYTLAESTVRFITLGQRYEPDLLIIFHATNDVAPGMMDDFKEDYANFKKPYRKEAIPLVNYLPVWHRSRLYSVFRNVFIRIFGKSTVNDFYWPTENYCKRGDIKNLTVFRENLETIIAVARLRGTVVALTQWNYSKGYKGHMPDQEYLACVHKLIDVTQQVADKLGTLYLRIGDKMPDDKEFYTDWCHYTDVGLQRLAQVFFTELQQDTDSLIKARIRHDKKSL